MRPAPESLLRRTTGGIGRVVAADPEVARALGSSLRSVLVSGSAITVPFVVTVLVVGVVVDFVGGLLAPFARLLTLLGVTAGPGGTFVFGTVLASLLALVVVAGVLAETGRSTGLQRRVGAAVESVPGIGSVYTSFDRMSEVLLDGDGRSFRDVKLVEFPHSDVYSLAFQTSTVAPTGPAVDDERMLVLFVPLAPNPVMGGFMVCVPASRVRDVDMTVQEAFQALVTSGVAMPDPTGR